MTNSKSTFPSPFTGEGASRFARRERDVNGVLTALSRQPLADTLSDKRRGDVKRAVC
jgi:hypothetical protein